MTKLESLIKLIIESPGCSIRMEATNETSEIVVSNKEGPIYQLGGMLPLEGISERLLADIKAIEKIGE